jgi:L-rhamnose-H+ transport protein
MGLAVALGYCAVFRTLLPHAFHGEFTTKILSIASGDVILGGVAVCLAGIAITGLAGRSKERELSDEAKRSVISEFTVARGILVATFSGILSACMAYGLGAAQPLPADRAVLLSVEHGGEAGLKSAPGRPPGGATQGVGVAQ